MDGATTQGSSWAARLQLGFARQGTRTVLERRAHVGPLVVQKPFHPEPDGTCHVVLLHPPGGVVGGDSLGVEVDAAAHAQALLTTPAATKLYRSDGRRARLRQHLRGARDARLEWLPHETIAFEGTAADVETRVDLEVGASFIGWELLCLGRPAANERFERGDVRQELSVWREGVPLFVERARYTSETPVLDAPWGLGGAPVVGVLVAVAGPATGVARDIEAAAGSKAGRFAASELRDVVVARYVGGDVEEALGAFRAAWQVLRKACFGVDAVEPRIWRT
jgi:urease accessory protein